MENRLQMYLQQWRAQCGLSIEKVAKLAGIAPSTLRRWEQGNIQPQLSALALVLDALHVKEQERQIAIMLLDVPRGRVERHKQVKETDDLWEWMPGIGDLWRAMRLRKRLTGKQLADCVDVDASRITRIEQSKIVPDEELRVKLFAALNAFSEERDVLSRCRTSFGLPLEETNASVEECEERLLTLRQQAQIDATFPGDLCFLMMEEQLWSLATRKQNARRVLALAWTYHADHLLWRGRLKEMNAYAHRAIEITHSEMPKEEFRVTAAVCCAHYIRMGTNSNSDRRAYDYLANWLELALRYSHGIGVHRTLGEYAGASGYYDQAFQCLQASRRIALQHGDQFAERLANLIEARILVQAGRAADALLLLPTDEKSDPNMRLFELLDWASTLMATGDRTGATYWLSKFYEHTDKHHLEYHRWCGNELASQL